MEKKLLVEITKTKRIKRFMGKGIDEMDNVTPRKGSYRGLAVSFSGFFYFMFVSVEAMAPCTPFSCQRRLYSSSGHKRGSERNIADGFEDIFITPINVDHVTRVAYHLFETKG